MPLNKGCSVAAFRDNIAKSIKEGKPRDQAVAIAISTLKSACKSAGKPTPDVGSIEKEALTRSPAVWGLFNYLNEDE